MSPTEKQGQHICSAAGSAEEKNWSRRFFGEEMMSERTSCIFRQVFDLSITGKSRLFGEEAQLRTFSKQVVNLIHKRRCLVLRSGYTINNVSIESKRSIFCGQIGGNESEILFSQNRERKAIFRIQLLWNVAQYIRSKSWSISIFAIQQRMRTITANDAIVMFRGLGGDGNHFLAQVLLFTIKTCWIN